MTKMPDNHPYRMKLSLTFVGVTFVLTTLAGFAIGKIVRSVLIDQPFQQSLQLHQTWLQDILQSQDGNSDSDPSQSNMRLSLPDPVMRDGNMPPHTLYSSKNFDTSRSVSVSSRWIKPQQAGPKSQCGAGDKCAAATDTDNDNDNANEHDDKQAPSLLTKNDSIPGIVPEDDEEEHLPAGQHLLLDIENVSAAFLNSEERLAIAMLDLVNQCGLTLLSYHCHKMSPSGVTCAGVLLESHVSFHTWPERGVITLDLFTCGPNSLLPVVPQAKKLFSIPREPSYPNEKVEPPHVVWAHKLRGFRDDDAMSSEEAADAINYPIGQRLDYKETVTTVQTNFQRIEIYDAFRLGKESYHDYEKSIAEDGSYHALNPKFFQPDRIVFLDGVLQSRRSGDAAYHEALVHPTMFAHDNPKRVAIIGGGEGATLREVLKHKTVEHVAWIEIDQTMVEVSTELLPEWSDCSDFEGSADSCLDDPRVEIYYEDAFKWFDDRYPESGALQKHYDVVIMDALDPQVQIEFVDALYSEGTFLKSISRSLADDGIMVAQVGQAPKLAMPAEDFSINKNRMKFILSLVELEFGHVRNYEESHCGFSAPWEIIVAMKNFDTKANWFDNAAVVDYKIRTRTLAAKPDGSPFHYFDGSTMTSYHFPSRQSEVVYCRRIPTPSGCVENRGFDQERVNLPASVLEVKASSVGEKAGSGVFAKDRIPKQSYVGLERLVHSVYFDPRSFALIDGWYQHSHSLHDAKHMPYSIEMYAGAFGHSFNDRGNIHIYADASMHTFINHGCRGNSNVGHNLTIHESMDIDGDSTPLEIAKVNSRAYAYNPSTDRTPHFFSSGIPLRDIEAGEELFDNYLGMIGFSQGNWRNEFDTLKAQCSVDA